MSFPYTIYALGDSALTVDFGNLIEDKINSRVLDLFYIIQQKQLTGVTDIVPSYSAITIHYDLMLVNPNKKSDSAFEAISSFVKDIIKETSSSKQHNKTRVKIPVCYDVSFGPDITFIAREKKITVTEIARLHTEKIYRVYMIGFLPGFPYMGAVDEKIAVPRRSSPRENVVAGSVGIAGIQTGIYPLASPGGWQIIGRTPISIFDKKANENAVLLKPGDEVQFYSITTDEFENYKSRNT
ncbi:MAG: pxpB [Chitinophagaceae bacterium]|nr:pxpB [Chitinophagaceae bacterium]